MKKWIVERNGFKYIESTSGFKPVDALIEYTGQIPESDIPYSTIIDGEITVDAVLKFQEEKNIKDKEKEEKDKQATKQIDKLILQDFQKNDLQSFGDVEDVILNILNVLNIKDKQ